VPAAPVAALVADADVAKAVIDAAIVADVWTPVATVKAIAVIVVAPVAGGPERALIGSLHPSAGNPVVTASTPGPVAGRPKIAVARRLGLVVIWQGRRRLIRVFHGLSAVAGIVRTLVSGLAGGLSIGATGTVRSALLGSIGRGCGRA
jgi:hypothetical protein